MTKRLMQFRICDKCPSETDAVVTERIGHNGETFSLDLCQKHSDALALAIAKWTDAGTRIGTASRFDARRSVARPTVVDLEPLKAAAPVIDLDATPEPEAPPVARRTLPAYPMVADRWELTSHARDRMASRRITEPQVRHAAERPEQSLPSKRNPSCELRTREGVTVVVNPFTEEVLTVYRSDEAEDDMTVRAEAL